MRILLTSYVFLPDFFGGTETLVQGVALALKRRGHDVVVVTGQSAQDDPTAIGHIVEYEVDSIRVIRFMHAGAFLGAESIMRNEYDNPAFSAHFGRILDDFRPHVVHFHHFKQLSIKAIDACVERGIPAFLTATDFWYVCPMHALLLPDGKTCEGPASNGGNCAKHLASMTQPRWLAGIVNYGVPTVLIDMALEALRRSSREFSGRMGDGQALARRGGVIAERLPSLKKIFVPTRHTQDVLERNGIKGAIFRVLPFGIKDHGYEKRIRRKPEGDLVLGFIGSLLPHKGPHVLLEAMGLLPAASPVRVRIYGKSPNGETRYVTDLRSRARNNERISFCGTFENEKLPDVLDELDALVIPSLWHENMPLVSLSAQAAGCPIIASDIGGLSDIIAHGKNGLLFAPGSASELARTIRRLLSERDLLRGLSSAAVTPPSIEQYADELELEYRQPG